MIRQCEWALPVPQRPQELGWLVQGGIPWLSPWLELKTESRFFNRVDPHSGQTVPSHFAERTSSSLSRPHLSQ